ncbi:hypothetical protein Taro_051558 [Colocasia esculenta]|uniref:Uncharacterized protein n=1 Tax=Colocasia esculenta TaxID=4460 RepID=A0A843XH45_COLES|nr:hypothetical protein [Colocasia esculenta]
MVRTVRANCTVPELLRASSGTIGSPQWGDPSMARRHAAVARCCKLRTDMVHGARSGSSSGRRMSSGRGSSAASGLGQFTPPPPTIAVTKIVTEITSR